MFLNGSDISNVKGYAFSRAATLTEVSILNWFELKLNHHSILQSKRSQVDEKLWLFFKLSYVSLWKIHKWKMFHIFLWNLTLIYDTTMDENKEISFFAAKYYYNTSQEKIQKRKYFYCILSLPHALHLT